MHGSLPNIVLIGMPGSGKSTVGVLLAKRLGQVFIDTDCSITEVSGRALQEILDRDGSQTLKLIEEQVICALSVRNAVIATGGSAVYSAKSMNHLGASGWIVHLRCDLRHLDQRIANYASRGIVRRPGQTLLELFEERDVLYRKYADFTIDTDGKSPDDVVEELFMSLSEAA